MSDDRTATLPAPPVHFEHWCDQPGGTRWESFGKERGRLATVWRCGEHLAGDYWDGRSATSMDTILSVDGSGRHL